VNGPGREASARGRRLARLGAAALAVVLGAAVAWLGSDRLERRSRFCISCHLDADTPLHIDLFEDFGTPPPEMLAAAHAAAGHREDAQPFRCIDCHGGTGLLGRARVKLLSVRDAFWYAVGRFEEPEGMRWPLWDADCRKCHDAFEDRRAAFGDPLFHELPAHQGGGFAVRCVECHLAHEPGALPAHDFLVPAVVRGQCARCHPEFEEEAG
jgi:hypothetical protein